MIAGGGQGGGGGGGQNAANNQQDAVDWGKAKTTLRAEVPEEDAPDLNEQRENVRGVLASILVAVLAVLAVGCVVLVAQGALTDDDLQSISQLIITPVVAIVGSVVGFYFGGQTAENARKGRRPSNG